MSDTEYFYRLGSAGCDSISELIDSELSDVLDASEEQLSKVQGLVVKFTQIKRDARTLRILHQLEFNFEGVIDSTKANDARTKQRLLQQDWFQCSYVIIDYTSPEQWLERCIREKKKGHTVVALAPVRTFTNWFHDLVLKGADEVRFVQGRVRVGEQVCKTGDCIVIYRGIDNTSIDRRKQLRRQRAVTIFNCTASFTEPGFSFGFDET